MDDSLGLVFIIALVLSLYCLLSSPLLESKHLLLNHSEKFLGQLQHVLCVAGVLNYDPSMKTQVLGKGSRMIKWDLLGLH